MSCSYYKFSSSLFGGDYWCAKNDCRVDEETYRKYCRDYNYSSCPIFRKVDSSGCFITTIVCDILKKPDDDKIMKNLRYFRDNVLSQNSNNDDILKVYDNIGPVIADKLIKDNDRTKMADGLYNNALVLISEQIEKKDYTKAINNYMVMTLMLINYYGLKSAYAKSSDKNYDYGDGEFDRKVAGHGKRRIKK